MQTQKTLCCYYSYFRPQSYGEQKHFVKLFTYILFLLLFLLLLLVLLLLLLLLLSLLLLHMLLVFSQRIVWFKYILE